MFNYKDKSRLIFNLLSLYSRRAIQNFPSLIIRLNYIERDQLITALTAIQSPVAEWKQIAIKPRTMKVRRKASKNMKNDHHLARAMEKSIQEISRWRFEWGLNYIKMQRLVQILPSLIVSLPSTKTPDVLCGGIFYLFCVCTTEQSIYRESVESLVKMFLAQRQERRNKRKEEDRKGQEHRGKKRGDSRKLRF